MGLQWEAHHDGTSWFGYSGKMRICMIVRPSVIRTADGRGIPNPDGRYVWHMDGLSLRKGPHNGYRKTPAAARRQCDKLWADWLIYANLQERTT